MGVMGRDITIARNDGVSDFGSILSFAESKNWGPRAVHLRRG